MDFTDRFESAFAHLMKNEGGCADHPADPGGATCHGISLRFLRGLSDTDGDSWLDGDLNFDGAVDKRDVQVIASPEKARPIIHQNFWRPQYELLDSEAVALKVFDLAFWCGPGRAHRWLQETLCDQGFAVHIDGAFGPKTLAAANKALEIASGERRLLNGLREQCKAHVYDSIQQNPALEAFRRGWLIRAGE